MAAGVRGHCRRPILRSTEAHVLVHQEANHDVIPNARFVRGGI